MPPKNKATYPEDILRLAEATHYNPYGVLGLQSTASGGFVVRTFQPHARGVNLLTSTSSLPMKSVHPHGIYEVTLDQAPESYTLEIDDREMGRVVRHDPYAPASRVGIPDTDLYLFGEGTHFRTYDHMGAHRIVLNGVSGVRFAVRRIAPAHRLARLGRACLRLEGPALDGPAPQPGRTAQCPYLGLRMPSRILETRHR
jgi:1,4-alpha-glucan branching enzyme